MPKTGGRRYREKLAKLRPVGSFGNWNARAEQGIASAATAASSYKSAEIPADAAKRIYDTLERNGHLASGEPIRILDAAAGEGGFGEAVRKELEIRGVRAIVDAVDITPELLAKNPAAARRLADIAAKKLESNSNYHAVLIRYGLEGLPRRDQLRFLRHVRDALKPGGVYYAVNMVSPDGAKGFMRKYKFAKRASYEQGAYSPYIATHGEHLKMMASAGLRNVGQVKPSKTEGDFYRSAVTTTKWMNSDQFGKVSENPEAAEERRLAVVRRLYGIANPAAQVEIQLKFTNKKGKEIPLGYTSRRKPSLHEVSMSWPVGAYVGERPMRRR
ncbi:hypothetical protein COU39_04215 [Candidatus Micrarchaeota archaeon CG10_big_fil_rev_8_21_14_0_10_60_32]|nr:MAG: hypothetical protein COU39_04215 [Candidatus Micrarchaeota archaeon CG10_big_fil_rev_8_21_14_0_10_60_32]